MRDKIKVIVGSCIAIIVSVLCGLGIGINIKSNEDGATQATIEVDTSPVIELPAPGIQIEDNGIINTENAPMVEVIDGGKIPEEVENDETKTGPEAARGDVSDIISTPWSVMQALEGQCIYLNNPYGSQCYNTTALIMYYQVGYYPSTAGTGAAWGIWEDRYKNAGGECGEIQDGWLQHCKYYDLIYDATRLRDGDLEVLKGGLWGHTGEVAGVYKDGYNPLFSTNQGGKACDLGGSAANFINISTSNFLGAFRWHGWDYLFEEPEPVAPETPDTGAIDE